MIIIPSKPNMGFSKVPHSITFSDLLTAHQKMVWIMLDATCYNRKTDVVSTAKLAKKWDLSVRSLQKTIKELISMGFITRDGDDYSLQVEPKEDAESIRDQNQRRLTRDEKLRLELKDIWNKYKPKNAPSMQDFTPARLKTLRVYVDRFTEDEQVILRRVLDGSNANEFRRGQNWDFGNIFGHGVPSEQKQSTVEKVYREGCSAKARNAVFDHKDDQCWLDWFHAKKLTEMTKVVRLEMARKEAWAHQVANEGDGTIYVYTEGERLVHWTYKENSCGVSYLPTAK